MTNFRRVLLAIFTLIGITVGSLVAPAYAAVPFVDIASVTTCTPDGWKVDYTAGSFGSVLPWKVRLTTLDWLPWINTYQDNFIPFTRSTGVLPFSQATTPLVKIDVQWTNGAQATDSETIISRPAGCVAPQTTTTTTTVPPTTTTTTAPATTTSAPVAPETTAPTAVVAVVDTVEPQFPVTGNGDGGLLIGGILFALGAGALLVARRPKNA